MTTTTTETKTRTITLTGRAPVKIVEAEWPVIAQGSYRDHDGQVECQANRTWKIEFRVRKHADGRAIVYATYDHDTHFQNEACETNRVGVMIAAGDDIPAAISQVSAQLHLRVADDTQRRNINRAEADCVADLPAEVI